MGTQMEEKGINTSKVLYDLHVCVPRQKDCSQNNCSIYYKGRVKLFISYRIGIMTWNRIYIKILMNN